MNKGQQVAKIEENEGAWEPLWDVTVYERGRLIHVLLKPDQTSLHYCRTEQEARAALAQFYPDVPIVSEEAFKQYYEEQGYIYPPLYSRETDLLCLQCPTTTLKLEQRSIGAGRNAPHGALITRFYDCPTCHRVYACQSQELSDGWYDSWGYEDPETKKFIDCHTPSHLPAYNPYGFRETLLFPKKAEVVEK